MDWLRRTFIQYSGDVHFKIKAFMKPSLISSKYYYVYQSPKKVEIGEC